MSNFSKFKRGDKIINNADRSGKVLDTYKQDGKFMIHVQMDSGFRTDFKEDELRFYHEDIEHKKRIGEEYIGDKCPKCGTLWTRTVFGNRKWSDCIPCGKTAEDILDQNTKSSDYNRLDADFEDDFFKLLADWGTD